MLELRCQLCHSILWVGTYSQSKRIKRPYHCNQLVGFYRMSKDYCISMLCQSAYYSYCDCYCGGRFHGQLIYQIQ